MSKNIWRIDSESGEEMFFCCYQCGDDYASVNDLDFRDLFELGIDDDALTKEDLKWLKCDQCKKQLEIPHD